MKKILFTLLIFCTCLSRNFAQSVQNIIAGEVTSQQTGAPIPDVNVFLSQTTLGSTTGKDGTFRIQGVPNGIYNLVFSFIGFKTEVKRIQFFKSDSVFYEISLHPVNTKLEGILVTAKRDYDWLNNLEIFKREFLGSSDNAEKTIIKNPEVLNFKWSDQKSKLTAISNRELHIVNNALGYEIFLVLKKFAYIPSTDNFRNKTIFVVFPRYKKIDPVSDEQKNKWLENRKEAYKGSLRHFMYALYHDDAGSEHFNIKHGSIDKIDQKEKEYLLRFELLSRAYKKSLKAFQYSIYPSKDSPGVAIEYSFDEPSFLYPIGENIFFIDKYGNVLKPESIIVGGKWYADRMAEALPLNYTPED